MFNEARPGWKENPLRTGRKKESLFCNSPQFFIGAPLPLPSLSPPLPALPKLERGGGGRGERGEGVTRHQKEVSKKPSEWREGGGENTSLRERGEEEGPSSLPLSPPDKSQPRPPPSPGLLRLSSLSILPSPPSPVPTFLAVLFPQFGFGSRGRRTLRANSEQTGRRRTTAAGTTTGRGPLVYLLCDMVSNDKSKGDR